MNHQFYYADFFIPTWDIKYLFLGTFNPSEGEKVTYFYSRNYNFKKSINFKSYSQIMILMSN
jgi:hypothetical protein